VTDKQVADIGRTIITVSFVVGGVVLVLAQSWSCLFFAFIYLFFSWVTQVGMRDIND